VGAGVVNGRNPTVREGAYDCGNADREGGCLSSRTATPSLTVGFLHRGHGLLAICSAILSDSALIVADGLTLKAVGIIEPSETYRPG
jgi:hypothetical protein